MSWNLPDGCTDRDIDYAAGGYDEYDDEHEYEEPELEQSEIEVITAAEMYEAMAEEAGDRAYDAAEEYRLFPATIGPFEPPAVRIELPLRLPPQQGELFKEVA